MAHSFHRRHRRRPPAQRPHAAGALSNTALTPLPASARPFDWHDHAALWLSLGVGLLVMQVGSYLVPALGPRQALLMIVIGSLLGSGLLAWTARIGCESGLSSAGLMHATYGSALRAPAGGPQHRPADRLDHLRDSS